MRCFPVFSGKKKQTWPKKQRKDNANGMLLCCFLSFFKTGLEIFHIKRDCLEEMKII